MSKSRIVLADFTKRRSLVMRRRPGCKVCAVIRWVDFKDQKLAALDSYEFTWQSERNLRASMKDYRETLAYAQEAVAKALSIPAELMKE